MDSFWDFFWFTISFFLLMAYLVVLFQILTDLFRDKDTSGWAKAVWVFFLIIFPLVTSLVYLIARGKGMTERNIHYAKAAQADTDAYIRSVSAGAGSPSEEIARAKALLDAGTINQAEYDALKAKALV
ncbi:SHOCT domain-containing protein [Nocardioides sp. YIM 152315]|uniref:SHOCT domain-containing protein n=1 Tax=Nocardioides sp. YIM 152315 TaxID=3031760 RepID=UPI0023DA5CAB|nr:SHOCT domain-containing protein [Nocardioides sp. YIM 152315]MDF1603893.1 SHOCT domain-containing protein [Nocardioides sp. YIM 152315]